ncbi:MAG TPA: isocitrate lyase/phosphoenolpyruvate mutase family protein [Pseudonocardia sp.]|nr:isocitrate lyase/phosphoenolpyruvate mutase family protein [Pseudonocardia sp.]
MPYEDSVGAAFRALHETGRGFLMPNAWDAGSAVILAEAGFDAIATTSAGIAFSLGRGDHTVAAGGTPVGRSEMFDRIEQITSAVRIPVNGDLEYGYGVPPEAVAQTIRLAIDAGLAGGNIEDHVDGALLEPELASARIEAAREVVDASGRPFVLTARTDALLPGGTLAESVRRANLYRLAGADCLYAPGVKDLDSVATLVREVDGPLNVVLGLGGTTLTVPALRAAGVARISLGGSIARAALGFVRASARELLDHGTLEFAAQQIPQRELNALFARYERTRTAATP